MTARSLAIVAAGLMASCFPVSDAPVPAARAVTDSAGIRIVRLSLESMPVCALSSGSLRIGSLEGAGGTGLTQVQDVDVLQDGRIGVLDYQEAAVLLFAEDGTPAGRIGGRGDGPGELDRVWFLDVLSDGRILVGDYLPFAWHLYRPDGRHLRTVVLSPEVRGRPDFAFPLGDRPDFVVQDVSGRPTDPTGRFTDETRHVIRYSYTGEAVDSLGQLYFRRTGFTDLENRMVEDALFGARGSVFPVGDLVGYASGRDPEVRLLEPGGAPLRIIRWPSGDREVRSAIVSAARAEMRSQLEGLLTDDRIDQYLMTSFDSREVAERLPAYGRVTSGEDGGIWIERFVRPGTIDPPEWFVLEPSGRVRCSLAMPTGFIPMHFSRTRLIGVELDELRVPYVVAHEVLPPRAG